MRILLTGASGSVGYQTAKKLIDGGHEITLTDLPTRDSRRRLRAFRGKARVVYGSINDVALMEGLIREADVVIHLAAVIPPRADRQQSLAERVNEGGTAVIVDAIRTCNPGCFLIYASSISVYGDRVRDYWIQVGDPLRPSEGDHYAVTKIHAEEYIRAAGIRYTILRFTAIMGLPKTDPLMFHMPLETRLEIASTWDTGAALAAAAEKQDQLEGRTFDLGGGPGCRTTYEDFLHRMLRIYGLRFRDLLQEAFAAHNFHCGWYLDSQALEDILHFQHTDLEGYYAQVQRQTRGIVRFFSRLFSRPILYFLTRKSEPLMARRTGNPEMMERFFGKEEGEEEEPRKK